MCFRPAGIIKPIRCGECNTVNPPKATTCRKCGAAIEEEVIMIKCPECGEMNPSTGVKCTKCGFSG